MRSERWKGADRESWQALPIADIAQATCGDGTCKKRYFGGSVDLSGSAANFASVTVWYTGEDWHLMLTSSTRDIRDVISNQQPQFMGYL